MSALLEVPLDRLDVGRNVRARTDAGLTETVREHGVIAPVTVRETGEGRYRLIAGHRRVKAARTAGLGAVPALVVDDGADDALLQLVENVARRDLSPFERAAAIKRLVDDGMSQADVARHLGLNPSTIANDLRLLRSEPEVCAAVMDGRLGRSHAKAIASLPASEQRRIAAAAEARRLSAHEVERMAAEARTRSRSVSLPLHGAHVTIGAGRGRVDLVLEDGNGHGLMLDLSAEDARLLGHRLRQAAEAARPLAVVEWPREATA